MGWRFGKHSERSDSAHTDTKAVLLLVLAAAKMSLFLNNSKSYLLCA